jgi:DNA-binding transcriptional regulator LsrR (DeoR family)
VNGDKYQPHSLKAIPAMLHRSFSHPHREVVRKALRLNPNYAQIFGEPGSKEVPLINRFDTILTSVASLGQPAKMFGRDLMELAGVSKEDQANIVGDLGGAIIPRINADRKIFDDIASLWTGITLDDYRRVGREAHDHSTPGVVVFAIGGTKATLIHHLLSNEAGIISHLIIDHELAMCLDKLLR